MKTEELRKLWKAEEAIAHIKGWDFSHIEGRYTSEDSLPWDYRAAILEHLHPQMQLLDIDTGGGEFLLSLNHPHRNTAAMENYPPNIALCAETLLPLGIDFRPGSGGGPLPFEDCRFDLVINRHGDFHADEIFRVLKPSGLFITQQVGADNDRALVRLLSAICPRPSRSSILPWWRKNSAGPGLLFFRVRKLSPPSGFMMWVPSSGSPGSSSGSTPVSPWIPILTGCWRPSSLWKPRVSSKD